MEDLPSDPSLMDDNTVYFALDQGVIFFLKADNTAAYFYSRSFDNDLFVPGTGTDSVCMKISDPQFVNFANGLRSMAIGTSNKSEAEGSFSCGRFNDYDSSTVFSVGIGIDGFNRKNGLSVKDNGDVYYKDDLVDDIHNDILLKAIALASAGSGLIKFTDNEGKARSHQISSSVKISTKSPVDVYYVDSESISDLTGLFKDCSLMASCNLESSVLEATTMDSMFENCKSLSSNNLHGLSCPSAESLNGMFRGCTGLSNTNVISGSWPNVTDVAGLFEGCAGITGIASPGSLFDFSGISDASSMYMGCTGLDSVNLYGGGMMSSDADMKNMFKGCSNVNVIRVENEFLRNKTNVSDMFNGCGNVDFRTRNNTDMIADSSINASGMFRNCSSVNVPKNISFQNNCNISYMFSDCGNVDVNGISCSVGCNASGIFSDCSNVIVNGSLEFSGSNTNFSDGCANSNSVKINILKSEGNIDCSNAFAYCGSVGGVGDSDIPEFRFNDNANLSNMFMNSDISASGVTCKFADNKNVNCSGMFKNAVIDGMSFMQSWTGLDSITNATSMFEECEGLNVMDHTLSIGATNATNMFKNTGLIGDTNKDVVLKTLFSKHSEGVTTTGTFSGTRIIGAKFTGGVSCTGPKEMFKDCSELQYVEADSDTVLKGDMSYMFSGCHNLLSINGLKDVNIRSAGDMAYMFAECQDISILALPAIAKQESVDFTGMFNKCRKLTSVTFGNESAFNNKQPDILKEMFADCDHLQSIHNMPSIVLQRDNCADIFKGCGNLTYLTFHNDSKFTITAEDDQSLLDFSSSKMLTNSTIDVIVNALVNNGKQGTLKFSNECVAAYDAQYGSGQLDAAISSKGWKLIVP